MERLLQRSGTASVVIIDDTDEIRFLVRISLEAGGDFEVVGEADNGLEGIDVVARTQPDLVLLDLRMPVMTGLDALPRIKRACPTTRVVVLSGFSSASMAGPALDAGADGYAQKGMSPVEIAQYAAFVLNGPSAPHIPQQSRRS